MNKKTLLICLFLALFCFVSSMAFSDVVINSFKVASVNVPQIVYYSKEVQSLKESRKAKTTELAGFITKAKEDLQKETDIKKRKLLEDNYNNELKKKKEKLARDNARQILNIDNKIKKRVAVLAQKYGYNLVISKNAVLYGSEDITSEIINK